MKVTPQVRFSIRALAVSLLLCGSELGSSAIAAEGQISIPATSQAIWTSIDQEVAQLDTTLKSGKLDSVHLHAFAIRDLAAALPAKSTSLPADKLAQLKADNKFIATLAERLDASGDAHDMAGTASNLSKLKNLLKAMRGLYGAPAQQ